MFLSFLLFFFLNFTNHVFFFLNKIIFAQAPPDPGRDPLKSDSTIEIPVLQTGETSHSDVSNYLSAGKKTSEFDKISESLLLAKKDDKGVSAATE